MLPDVVAGTSAIVRRISEVAEHEARTLLNRLSSVRIAEGTEVRVTDAPDASDRIRLLDHGDVVTLEGADSRMIWVEITA
jgi:hypothetical protein